MKKLILIVFLLAWLIGFVKAQNNKKTAFKIPYPTECELVKGVDSIKAFYISTQPITNRAYFIYMDWLKNCYKDYPEEWFLSWPDFGTIDGEISYTDCYDFLELINHSNELIRGYMFNPAYIDYPVLGLSWAQASDFCNWLSDRYNEYILIKKKFLTAYPEDYNENCFTLESYLAGQYERPGKKEYKDKITHQSGIKWGHHLLTPAFRLPSNMELMLAKKIKLVSDELRPYPLPAFLKYWQFFGVEDGKIILYNCSYETNENVEIQTINIKPPSDKYAEWLLDSYVETKNNSVLEIYNQLGQKILNYEEQNNLFKDSLGHMRYIILDEKDNIPLIIGRKPILPGNNVNSSNYCIFRYAVNAIKGD